MKVTSPLFFGISVIPVDQCLGFVFCDLLPILSAKTPPGLFMSMLQTKHFRQSTLG